MSTIKVSEQELSTLEIHKLSSSKQFKELREKNELQAGVFYLTPDDDSVGERTASGGEIFNDYENNKALGKGSHSEGCGTIANEDCQHVQGKYNLVEDSDSENYAHIVGNGESDTKRSNAHTLGWDGKAWFAGDITTGSSKAPHRGILTGTALPEDTEGVDGDIYIMHE